MHKKQRRHPFTLLEVMIALFLVVIALLPLIYPHVAIIKEEGKINEEITLFPLVAQIHASFIEKIYNKEISLDQIQAGIHQTIQTQEPECVINYSIGIQKKKEGSPKSHYLIDFYYTLEKITNTPPLHFHYTLYCQGPPPPADHE